MKISFVTKTLEVLQDKRLLEKHVSLPSPSAMLLFKEQGADPNGGYEESL